MHQETLDTKTLPPIIRAPRDSDPVSEISAQILKDSILDIASESKAAIGNITVSRIVEVLESGVLSTLREKQPLFDIALEDLVERGDRARDTISRLITDFNCDNETNQIIALHVLNGLSGFDKLPAAFVLQTGKEAHADAVVLYAAHLLHGAGHTALAGEIGADYFKRSTLSDDTVGAFLNVFDSLSLKELSTARSGLERIVAGEDQDITIRQQQHARSLLDRLHPSDA